MPVFRQTKLVFIHIPKTGGTAIERYFHQMGDMQWGVESWLGREQHQGRWFEYQHLSLIELQYLAGQSISGFRSFSIVRNPYERLLSDYLWRQNIKRVRPDAALNCFDSFASFLDAIPGNINTSWEKHIASATMEEANFLIHVRPQYHYITDGNGAILVDDILTYEQLDENIGPLLKEFGLAIDSIRKPQPRDLEEYYDRDSLDLVNHIYRKDFECFSYARKDEIE
jgi:hypothetical protein